MNLPNLFLIGAAKSGTSSLHDQLNCHAAISGARCKESHFFCQNSKERIALEDDYMKNFTTNLNTKYLLDSSTGYLQFEESIINICESCEDPKVIIILRNPIDRVVSHFNWLSGHGDENSNFWDALNEFGFDEPKYKEMNKGSIGYKHYISWGLYGKKIEAVYKYMKKESVKIIFFEDYKKSPELVLTEILTFLSINASSEVIDRMTNIHTNKSVDLKYKRTYKFLRNINFGFLRTILPARFRMLFRTAKLSLQDKIKMIEDRTPKFELTVEERYKLKELYKDDVDKLIEITDMTKSNLPWEDFK